MRMLMCSILSAVLLANLAQAQPLQNSDEKKSEEASKENAYTFPNNLSPNDYTIELKPHLDGKDFTYDGESSIDINISGSDTNTIDLHAVDLEIDKEFTSLTPLNGKTILKPMDQYPDTKNEVVTIKFANKITSGTYTLKLKYTGKLREDSKGFYRKERQVGEQKVWEAFTQFKPSYARHAFPCFDQAAMKARFAISIKRPENYKASSTTLQVKNDDENWTRFATTNLISVDDIDFMVLYVEPRAPANSTDSSSNVITEVYANLTTTESSVNSTTTEPSVNSTTTEPSVNATTTEPSINSTTTEPSVNSTTTESSVNSTTTESSVNSTTTESSVNSTTTEQSVNSTTTEQSVNSTTTEPSVNSTTTEQSVNSTTTEPSVNSTTTEPSVNSTTPEQSVNVTTTEPSVNPTTAEPSVNSTTAEPSVNSTTTESVIGPVTDASTNNAPYTSHSILPIAIFITSMACVVTQAL